MIILDTSEFGSMAVCAIRYCIDHQTYMSEMIRSIIRPNIADLSNKDLMLLINDCESREQLDALGDNMADKPSWIAWRMELEQERNKRRDRQADLRTSGSEG